MPRPKKGDPELNLVSFCDIVTVICVALFMAMIVVLDIAMRTPTIRPMPLAEATTNAPVYFECRDEQLFPIDHEGLAALVRNAGADVKTSTQGQEIRAVEDIMNLDLGNDEYKVDNRFLMVGLVALRPRDTGQPIPIGQNAQDAGSFAARIAKLEPRRQYLAFVVRDDAFATFRKARDLATAAGFEVGWEYIGRDEPITFEGSMAHIMVQ